MTKNKKKKTNKKKKQKNKKTKKEKNKKIEIFLFHEPFKI